jgi:hypothetical protein|tara:strand:+ start:51 stop:284 length:234 start_codon:yes stop_codon:yes gene_type:complete
MTKSITLGNLDKGILVNLDLSNGFKARLLNHLEQNHPDVTADLCFHEGGTIGFTGEEMQISGDNGLLILDVISIPTC